MSTNIRTWQTVLFLIGTIVGVGMFAIPFVFARAGFLTGVLELIVLAAAVTLIHLAYAEVVARTAEVHRLPGYVRYYLGPGWGWLSRVSYLFGLSGALLAYLVLGGAFLTALIRWAFPDVTSAVGPLAFYLFGVAIIARGIRFEGLANAVLTFGLVLGILMLGLMLFPAVSPDALVEFHPARLAGPYGVLLFSLAGAAIIPDLRRLLGPGGLARLSRTVIAGTLVSAGLYLVFAVAVVGATGPATTPDAISGLAAAYGSTYLLLGNLIGVLAAITSFIALGVVFEGMLVSDFSIRPRSAWLLTAAIPAVLYGLGFHDFITIISAVGALAIGLDSILILLIHRRIRAVSVAVTGLRAPISGVLRAILILMFIAGIAAEFAGIVR